MKNLLGLVLLVIVFGVLAFILKVPRLLNESLLNNSHVSVTFVGDMMFDRYIRLQTVGNQYENILTTELKDVIAQTDLLVGNLEGPITTFPSISNDKGAEQNLYTFTFDPSVADALITLGFDAVSIGNNHILNFGTEGLNQTKQFLTQAGVQFFGDPYLAQNFTVLKENSITIALVAENEFDGITPEQTADLIKSIDEKYDHVVVFAHWGNEYEKEAHKAQRLRAHSYIDAGADLIIGSHPHVIQNNEEYSSKYIYYSLGNFIFDQYWESSVQCGLIVRFNFTKTDITLIDEFNSYLERNGTTSLKEC